MAAKQFRSIKKTGQRCVPVLSAALLKKRSINKSLLATIVFHRSIFTGKGTPPKKLGSSVVLRKLISENSALMGYIDSADTGAPVKAVRQFWILSPKF